MSSKSIVTVISSVFWSYIPLNSFSPIFNNTLRHILILSFLVIFIGICNVDVDSVYLILLITNFILFLLIYFLISLFE